MTDVLHPLIDAAGRNAQLPEWSRCEGERLEHSTRVADLMEGWAEELGLPQQERLRWRAAGLLHDALKDVPPEELRALVAPGWPDQVAHAPACAARLRDEGIRDEGFLLAIAYHSVGHPDFDLLGEYLFMADFLDPGRTFLKEERADLRARLPEEAPDVLVAVLAYRLEKLLRRRQSLLPAAIGLWNRVVAP